MIRGTALLAVLLSACHQVTTPRPLQVPATILLRGEHLAASKVAVDRGDAPLVRLVGVLKDSADAAMSAAPISVMQKRRIPPSGNKHDFMSMAPYWWPDSTKPNGLPFIRRDGVMFPEGRVDHDGIRLQTTIARARLLALASYFTGDERYARGAANHLRVFFLDTATRMNPNLEYAQAVLGVNSGRGIGIIDSRTIPDLVDAMRLLELSPAWTAQDRAGMHAWGRAYLTWLVESKNGKDERAAVNNHGTFYDEQVAALALFVGDSVVARRTLVESARARIDTQIKADGSQPLEIERTRPLHYSVFNLDAFTMLAEMSRHVGADLWRYQSPGGGSLPRALRYIAPYADPKNKFPKPDLEAESNAIFLAPLRRAASQLGDQAFSRALLNVSERDRDADFNRLAFPEAVTRDAFDVALERAGAQLRRTANSLDPANGFPRSTKPDGNWTQEGVTQWTSGFFAGTLWYMYQVSRDDEWKTLAEKWQAPLERNKERKNTHDLGFIIFDSFGHGYLLTGNERYRQVVMEASRSLVTRYNPAVGAIKSWDTENATDGRCCWKFPVIVDNLMNLEMLFWASAHGGDSSWRKMAESHALVSAKAHVRADGSTPHVALFDPVTGALEKAVTWQGFADTSAWARGQAWAVHGFAATYGRSRRPELLAAAQKTADWFIAHLPADGVPFWDFRHPAIPNTERDASAAAIAAAGLYDLARYSDGANATRYRAAADRMLLALASHYMARETPSGAILMHSTGGRPQGTEIDVGLTYADYFFVEALLRRKGLFLE